MILEIKAQQDKTPTFSTDKGSTLLMTPPIDENYWTYRVHLAKNQYIVGFPKFSTIGIGFSQEEDWNTNLPLTCDAKTICEHIWHNHEYKEITKEQVIEAINLIRQQAQKDMGVLRYSGGN